MGHGWLGQADQAITESRRLLEDQARVLVPDHPATLRTRGNLAYWEDKLNPDHST
ncbi:MAG TPA: tetratricopeptide repeat protein [Candidatus Methylomirabilis sp.]|nr:tetratricopeptide repeat protein [Candidatus Methylomirabilis sp.]